MRIIGVDPGTIITGYGIIENIDNDIFRLASGIIRIPKTDNIAHRLEFIYDELDKIIKLYKPDEFSIETAFYGKNVQSAMKIGYARGVSLLSAAHNQLPASEYSPREIKKAVTGRGSASKEQVQYMIDKLLALRSKKMKSDESDALAAAICHFFKINSRALKSGTWKSFIEANPDRIIE